MSRNPFTNDWDRYPVTPPSHPYEKKTPAKVDQKPVTIYSLFPNIDRWGIGYDSVFETLKQLSQHKPSFPPYNLVKDGDRYEITMALAGYRREHLDIFIEDRVLTVKTVEDMEKDDVRDVIHQGIAQRNFTSTFALAEHVEVKSAKLEDGLLTIKLELELPESKKPRAIEIE